VHQLLPEVELAGTILRERSGLEGGGREIARPQRISRERSQWRFSLVGVEQCCLLDSSLERAAQPAGRTAAAANRRVAPLQRNREEPDKSGGK
jgi:hypothetical protein